MEEQLRKELMMATANVLGEKAASKLEMAFTIVLHKYKVETKNTDIIIYDNSNARILRNYIASLRLEGKSELTLEQYYRIINMFLRTVGKPVKQITTGDIRYYLARYMADRKVEKTNLCLFLLFGSRRIYRQKSYVANKKNQNRQKSKETIHGYGIGTIAELYRKY